jgi:two-component system response regulator HydG
MHCAGVNDSLLQSLLFGSGPSASVHAFAAQRTLPEAAAGGTMFLKDVDALSPPMQQSLFAFLDAARAGEEGLRCSRQLADVRVVTAASPDIASEVAAGRFHESLFYRLNVIYIAVPALRAHAEDIPELLDRFLTATGRFDAARPQLSPEAVQLLQEYAWPGNLGELRRTAELLARKAAHREIVPGDLPSYFAEGALTRAARPAAAPATPLPASLDSQRWSIAHPMTDFSICH